MWNRVPDPLPTPEDFAKYDAALPGAAERILKMAEEEQGKRNGFVEKGINLHIYHAKTGAMDWHGCCSGGIGGGCLSACIAARAGPLSGLAA